MKTTVYTLNPLLPILALILALLAGCAATQTRSGAPEFYTQVEGITEFRLDNGLRVLLVPDDSRPSTTVNITYLVGSRHEGYGESGMAHLLEHLLFKSSENYADITEEIARRGGRANGTTWYDRTNYFQTFPATDENLTWALSMEADRMINALLKEEDLASEMTVVRNEFEIGENNPFRILMQRTAAVAHEWHGYGRSTIGARTDIENVPMERLRNFYRRYYQPDNAVLVVSGRFDQEQTLELIQSRFGVIPAPERVGDMVIWPTYTRNPTQDGERRVTLRRNGDYQLVLSAFHVPAAAHEDYAALDALAHILGNEPSGRLYKALVETELAAAVGSWQFTPHEPGLKFSYARLRSDDDIQAAEDAMLEVFAGLRDNPITEEELNRARNALIRDLEVTLRNSDRVGIQLTEWAAAGDWRLLFIYRDRLRELTVEDVQRVADHYLKSSNRTLGWFIPDSAPDRSDIPEAPPIEELVAGYVGDEDRAAGETFEPTFENIEARLQRFELENGLKVALLPKSTRGGTVNGQLTLRLGSEDTLMGQRVNASLASAMLMRGTRQRSRQEITDTISDLQSQLSIGGGSQVTARLETIGENLMPLMGLLAEVLTQPSFDESEFNRLRQRRLADLEAQRNDPNGAASWALNRIFRSTDDPAHPNYSPTLDEELAAIESAELNQVREFYQRFYGLGPGATLTLVGDFDAEAVRAWLENHTRWRPATPYQRIPATLVEPDVRHETVQIDDRPNAMLLGLMQLPIRDDHEDYPALVLGNHLLGGGFLNSRLARRIRQQEGISYGVGSNIGASAQDPVGHFVVYAMYAPENRERLHEALQEELRRVLEEPYTREELQYGLEGWLQQQEVTRSNDGQLMGILSNHLYLGRDMHGTAEWEERVKALDADTILQAMRRHLDPKRLVIVEAGDFGD